MAKELELKYGCNPNQKPAKIFMAQGELPVEVLNGRPGYINFLDAFNSWQLVRELKIATGLPAAASFKHVSPAGAAVGLPLDDTLRAIYFTGDGELSPLACAYARARGADRMGEQYAAEHGYKIDQFPAEWSKYHQGAGPIRNLEMVKTADAVVAFWDNQSTGTKNIIDCAKQENIPYKVISV